MNGHANYSQADYERFLAWLAPDRESAGAKLLEISRRLQKVFLSRGCYDADLLTEKTVDRVITTIQPKIATYQGEVESYFFSVARFIILENPNPPMTEVEFPEPVVVPNTNLEPSLLDLHLQQLEQCLSTMEPAQQELLREYFDGGDVHLAEKRKQLAARLGVHPGALRIKVNRLKNILKAKLKDSLTSAEETDDFPLFSGRDLLDALGFVQKLTTRSDRLSIFLYEHFCMRTRRLVGQCLATNQLSKELRLAVTSDLNVVLKDPSLYDPKRFEQVALTSATKQLLAQPLPGDKLQLLNRCLLEDAFPNEIAKKRRGV
jgi:hypothetical protein